MKSMGSQDYSFYPAIEERKSNTKGAKLLNNFNRRCGGFFIP
jgi:hypothetical protein